MNHYERLGVPRTANAVEIREAYRSAARAAHPDRHGTASADRMARVNEAWRVLGDPARRRAYDDLLRATGADATGAAAGRSASASDRGGARPADAAVSQTTQAVVTGVPSRFPWRFLATMAVLGVAAVLVGSALTEPAEPGAPDGILRAGDCVAIALDADEVSCSGPHDALVEVLIPFDQTCPADTEAVRDRQGMGTACVVRVAPADVPAETVG